MIDPNIITIIGFDKKRKELVIEDSPRIKVAVMLSKNGDETDDVQECHTVLFQIPVGYSSAGQWTGTTIDDLDDYVEH